VLNSAKWDALHPENDYPDPDYSLLSQFLLYATQAMNLIDLAAILPLYINLALVPSSLTHPSASPASFAIIRLFRMIRITRIFKIIRERQDFRVLTDTLRISLPILTMLFYYTLLGTVVIAAVVFQFEQGEFKVTSAYPEGAYLRPSLTTHEGWEVSPFTSIWTALYWAVITATTLGYGDLYPTTPMGRLLSCLWIFCGIVIVAMPIGILGSQFSSTYEAYKEREEQLRKLNEATAASASRALVSPQRSSSSSSRRSSERSSATCYQKRRPLRLFPKLHLKYLEKRRTKICPVDTIAAGGVAQSPLSSHSPSPQQLQPGHAFSASSSPQKESPSGSSTSPPPLIASAAIARLGATAGESKGDDRTSPMLSPQDDEIVIQRQTLRDLFDLVKQLNQNKSEGSVIERKISEITLVLKKQEEERESSRR
jgi:hypothetical protein